MYIITKSLKLYGIPTPSATWGRHNSSEVTSVNPTFVHLLRQADRIGQKRSKEI